MSRFAAAKAALLSAFIAVAGCSDSRAADTAEADPAAGIFPGSFSFETDGLSHRMSDSRHTVVFDFKSDTMTVTDNHGGRSYTKSTNGPLTPSEEGLARFAESNVCFNMHRDKFEKVLADDNVESLVHDRGCSANNGIARVHYRTPVR
jgi:hypothetical protein